MTEQAKAPKAPAQKAAPKGAPKPGGKGKDKGAPAGATDPTPQVRAGTHGDYVGAFTRDKRESDDDLVARARVFVDTYAGALKEAGDLVQPIETGAIARAHVLAELAELCAGTHGGRERGDEVTLFKSVGTALEDLCAARLVAARHG